MTRSQSQSRNASGRSSPKQFGASSLSDHDHDDQSNVSPMVLAQKLALLVQEKRGGAANMVGDEASSSAAAAAAAFKAKPKKKGQ